MASSGIQTKSFPVAPDSVRVWRGYRLPSLEQNTFFKKLGSIFIPGTVQIQAPVGLTAYLPSVLPAKKPDGAPDEIAIVFYAYQNAYDEAKETVGGRAYSDLHGLVFDLSRSTSGFPIKYQGEIEPDMRYYLYDQKVDWQRGAVNAYVGMRKGDDVQEYYSKVGRWLTKLQGWDDGPDGAITVVADDYVTYWEHWSDESAAKRTQISGWAELTDEVYRQAIQPYPLWEGLWQKYDGVGVGGGESFNCQFRRRGEDD